MLEFSSKGKKKIEKLDVKVETPSLDLPSPAVKSRFYGGTGVPLPDSPAVKNELFDKPLPFDEFAPSPRHSLSGPMRVKDSSDEENKHIDDEGPGCFDTKAIGNSSASHLEPDESKPIPPNLVRSSSGRRLIGSSDDPVEEVSPNVSYRRYTGGEYDIEEAKKRFLVEVKKDSNSLDLRSVLKTKTNGNAISEFFSERESQNSPRMRRLKFADELGIPGKLELIKLFRKNEEINKNMGTGPADDVVVARSQCCTVS
eukprot:CAMPEP_0184491452 /NCGR_PEP_ID=MMETSP0113_2-20130426/20434_1 /TAXON_ID=91329 /ORGANISM="Norrisiella sphaerica, Strain BC52" /LENGTH=255 /DNA_ID=CAMNT_0026875827 /DNA_START=531 /DNA_END=1299 /DNA_ORIENTATION=-